MSKHSSIIAALFAVQAMGCATEPPTPTDVPQALKPAANESLAMVVPAAGVQIYECREAKNRPGAYEWTFIAPQADLFDVSGNRIGRHYAGPNWEAADGSMVVANVKARADAPRPGAIPWLLLSARSIGHEGSFSKVTSIQRAHTIGGLAPQSGCSKATAGAPAHVRYSAYYYLYSAN